MEQLDLDVYRKRVTGSVAGLCRQKPAAEPLLARLRQLTEQAEALLENDRQTDRSKLACRAGCGSCCVVNVAVLVPEALAIMRYLERLPPAERQEIAERLDELWRAVRGLDDEERVGLRKPCAFLDRTGSCRIYPVRPLLCRSITSTDAQACRQALTDQLFGESRPVLMHLFQRQLLEATYLGVADGLEQAELDGRGFQLTGLVRYLLKRPAAAEPLLAGKRLSWQELA